MVWQIPVILVLGLMSGGLLWSASKQMMTAKNARDWGNRMVELNARRMTRVNLIGGGLSGIAMLVVLITALI